MKTEDIQIRDPFILPVPEEGLYYLFGTTSKRPFAIEPDAWDGFDGYRSRDLQEWEGPFPAFRPAPGFWATTQFWAPEVHRYQGRYYMFASFKAPHHYRATQILVANQSGGPYHLWSEKPVTPPDWECLDGTLHFDEKKQPWIIFCHEWVQVHNGAMYALRLSGDLKQSEGRPVFLFNASEADWVTHPAWPTNAQTSRTFPTYVTDGPFLYRTKNGTLLMLWSSQGKKGYAMGIARSLSGKIEGPWEQQPEPLWADDGGHGMIFKTFEGRLLLTIHRPNHPPQERPIFRELLDEGDSLRLA